MGVSVLTVTNRWGGVDISTASLEKQTEKNFEWVLVDSHFHERKYEVAEWCKEKGITLKHIPEPSLGKGDVWNLNKAYNAGLRACEGEYILSYQDYIWLPGDGIEKFLQLVGDKTAVSGVGHKAKYPDRAANLEGKLTIFSSPFTGRPEGISELDTRIDGRQDTDETNYTFFELNYSFAPKKMYFDIGGFDEEFDKHYGSDNQVVGLKSHIKGYKFLLDKSNECIGFNQEAFFPRPADWESRHAKNGFFYHWSQRALSGEWSTYL